MKLGIIGAMDSEVLALQNALKNAELSELAGMRFCSGMLNDLNSVVVKCGIGKVNAAMCVQILNDQFHVTHIINTGVAGALSAKLEIGDIVVSEEAVQHDFDLSPIGFQKGEIPPYARIAFPADPELQRIALQAANASELDVSVLTGRVCSGDQFISGQAQKHQIVSDFGGLCAEMEGAAIAQSCCANNLPFVILRAISDRADDSGGVSFAAFEASAAKHSIAIVMQMTKLLSQ